MQSRTLGTQGLSVSALGLGCMNMTYGYGKAIPEADGIALIRRAFELGVRFLIPPKPTARRMNDWSARRSRRFVRRW